jgi:hypothetical protein
MPTEFRFDDLDLREEAASEKADDELDGATDQTGTCTATQRCTRPCCV